MWGGEGEGVLLSVHFPEIWFSYCDCGTEIHVVPLSSSLLLCLFVLVTLLSICLFYCPYSPVSRHDRSNEYDLNNNVRLSRSVKFNAIRSTVKRRGGKQNTAAQCYQVAVSRGLYAPFSFPKLPTHTNNDTQSRLLLMPLITDAFLCAWKG